MSLFPRLTGRCGVLVAGLALAVLAHSGVTPASAAAGSSSAAPRPVQPIPADSVADSFGINVHTAYGQTPYARTTQLTDALSELGVRHVRDRLYTGRPDQYARLRALRDAGIRLDLIAGDPTGKGGTPAELVTLAQTQLGGMVESFEGANEWNLKNRPGWVGELRAHQDELWAAVRSDPRYVTTPVLAPALGLRRGRDELGSMSKVADLGNNHLYPGGREPSWLMDAELLAEQKVVPGREVVVTEGGYHNAMADTGTHPATSEAATAEYMPRLLLEYVDRGVDRFYSYELLDQGTVDDDLEKRFGLVRSNYSRKPAFTAMKNTLSLFDDPGGPRAPAALVPLGVRVSSAQDDVRTLLTQKRDGSYLLAVWRRTTGWDPTARKAVAVPSTPVEVALDGRWDAEVFDPSASDRPVATSSRTSTLTVPVGNGVKVVHLDASPRTPVALAPVVAVDAQNRGAWPVSGTAEPGASVHVRATGVDRSVEGSTKASAAGSWSLRLDVSSLADGRLDVLATATAPGEHAPTTASGSAPKTTLPGSPDLLGTSNGVDRVAVTFAAPAHSGGAAVTAYEVAVQGPSGTRRATLPAAARDWTATGLTHGTSYRVSVAARTSVGSGPAVTVPLSTRARTKISARPEVDSTGRCVTVSGQLSTSAGTPLADKPVSVFAVASDGARTVLAGVVTDASGRWRTVTSLRPAQRFQADFPGDPVWAFSRSAPTTAVTAQ